MSRELLDALGVKAMNNGACTGSWIETAGDAPAHEHRCAALDQPARRVLGPGVSNPGQLHKSFGNTDPPSLHLEGRNDPEH